MNEKQTGVVPFNKELIEKLDRTVKGFTDNHKLQLFERAYHLATAMRTLDDLLTPEYMQPIMALQGSKLGFKADKEYGLPVVKACVKEAVLTGVQVVGNHFNIIAGNCYITKEGFGYLLGNTPGLEYKIVPGLPRISNDGKSAAIEMKITWKQGGGEEKTQALEIPIRVNSMMGVDAIIGKATRKARAWLYNTLNDTEVGDGDVEDQGAAIEIKDGISSDEANKASEDLAAKLNGKSNELPL